MGNSNDNNEIESGHQIFHAIDYLSDDFNRNFHIRAKKRRVK